MGSTIFSDPLIQLPAAFLLTFVFAHAALPKLGTPDTFEGVVANYRVLPSWLVRPAARGLPVLEIAIAAGLLLAPVRAYAAAGAVALLAVFAAAIAVNVLRGRLDIDCGCFRSETRQGIGWRYVVRNLFLVGVAFALLLPGSGRSPTFMDLAFVAAFSATAAILYTVANQPVRVLGPAE